MVLAAHQPHYLPYLGLLAKVALADVFVLRDTLQFTKQEWQNRNRIRTPTGWRWLTVPLHGDSSSRICDVMPADPKWVDRHERIVGLLYKDRAERLAPLWRVARTMRNASLAEINHELLLVLCDAFKVNTRVVKESSLRAASGADWDEPTVRRNMSLIALCAACRCDTYLSGPGGLNYLAPSMWNAAGLTLRVLEHHVEPYGQSYPGWVAGLSAIDALMCHDTPSATVKGAVATPLTLSRMEPEIVELGQ